MKVIIKKAVDSEKASLDVENNRFAFIVEKSANKLEIKKAIENMYGVSVEEVRTMNYGGGKAKTKYTAKGISYQRNKVYKKAIVTVAEGQMIDIYSNI